MYTVAQFIVDTAPIINFSVTRALIERGHDTETDDVQILRANIKKAALRAKSMIESGLPDGVAMESWSQWIANDAHGFEAWNRDNVIASVEYIITCANA